MFLWFKHLIKAYITEIVFFMWFQGKGNSAVMKSLHKPKVSHDYYVKSWKSTRVYGQASSY